MSTIHLRLADNKPPVHVYRPAKSEDWDGTVQIFLHGWNLGNKVADYYVDDYVVDFPISKAWEKSGSKSILIIPAGRENKKDNVKYPQLEFLLDLFFKDNIPFKKEDIKSVHILSHSGGYVNTLKWLTDPLVKRVTLLDSLYDGSKQFMDWIISKGGRHLDLACSRGGNPHKNCGKFLAQLPGYIVWQDPKAILPNNFKVNYIPLNNKHMDWVKDKNLLSKFFQQ